MPDPAARAAILELRNDPRPAPRWPALSPATMPRSLPARSAGQPTKSELYIAHFLGADGAGKLIARWPAIPTRSRPRCFPQAAGANRSIFYDGARPRSVADVTAGSIRASRPLGRAALAGGQPQAVGAAVPDTAGRHRGVGGRDPLADVPDNRPLFQAMFNDRANSAIAPAVTSLWSPTGTASGNTLDLSRQPAQRLARLFER